MPFPAIKLAYLALKQISKPIAKAIQQRAKNSPTLRDGFLVPIAQTYHTVETGMKLRLMGFRKSKKVTPLSKEMAIELGSDLLGEFLIFTSGSLIIFWEYRRQAKKEAKHETVQDVKIREIHEQMKEMELRLEEHSAQLRHLNRFVETPNNKIPSRITDPDSGTCLEVQKTDPKAKR